MTETRLPDRWHERDFPVLIEAARLFEAGEHADSRAIARKLDRDPIEVARVCDALDGAYLVGKATRASGHGTIMFTIRQLTERGRRAVGLWPSGDAADALIDALRQAEDLTDDPDDKSALRKAAGQLGSVSRNVIADLTTAYIRSQTGI